MKYMKKLMALLAALTLALAMAVPAFAETTTPTTYTITINKGTGTYAAYQIFKGDLHEGTLSNIEWGDNVTTAGQKALGNAADKAKTITTEADAKAFAVEVAKYLTDPAAGTGTDSITVSGPGYYLIKNTSVGEGEVFTDYILRVVGDVEVNPKSGKPTLDKQIRHNETGLWGVVGDNQIGDTVEFRTLTTVPIVSGYTQYTYVIHDEMSAGLTSNVRSNEDVTIKVNDETVLQKILDVKNAKKAELKDYLAKTQGIELNENSIYDIQIKRLHEYKRQQMNALYVIHKYFEIKAGKKPARPITVIFGAKAAPAYVIAKDIIHLILCLQELISKDPEVSPYLKVVMVENYNVTLAEKLIPAADIHEQISLASKEASGTSNMKFMLNGAVAIGTMDGANVEMHQFVGDDNIYIFGESSEQVIEHYAKADYVSRSYYDNDENIKRAIDFIVSDEMMAVGCRENLERLYNELLNKDWFMTLPDFEEYVAAKERIFADYEDRMAWAKKMLVNMSQAGFFSSDRTIAQYNEDIWHLN